MANARLEGTVTVTFELPDDDYVVVNGNGDDWEAVVKRVMDESSPLSHLVRNIDLSDVAVSNDTIDTVYIVSRVTLSYRVRDVTVPDGYDAETWLDSVQNAACLQDVLGALNRQSEHEDVRTSNFSGASTEAVLVSSEDWPVLDDCN
jgi:hypothetical protein